MRMFKVAIMGALLMSACVGQEPGAGGSSADVEKTSSAVTVGAGYKEDPPSPGVGVTACNGMHCCPDGYAMQGAFLTDNMFRCVRVSAITNPGSENSSCYVDGPGQSLFTVRNNMHACEYGYYMKGLRLDSNLLTCCPAPVPTGITGEYVDGSPPTYYFSSAWGVNAHICDDFGASGGSEFVMTGIRADQNLFNCGI
jgi:hypothetical protein